MRGAVLLGAFGLTLLFASPAAAANATLFGTVAGQLPGHEKAEPLAEVEVKLDPAEGNPVEEGFAAYTDIKGNYEVTAPQGAYNVHFYPPSGFEATTVKNVELTETRRLDLTLAASETVQVTGTLLDAEGNPVEGASVGLSNEASVGGSFTDAEGRFDVAVPTGVYYLNLQWQTRNDGHSAAAENQSFGSEAPIKVEGDRELELRLPRRHKLSYEVLGGGAPLAGVVVDSSLFRTGSVELAEGVAGQIYGINFPENQVTNEKGIVEYLTYGGTPQNETTLVGPPAESGYGQIFVKVPTVESDTSVTVNLGGGVEEPGEDTLPPSIVELGFFPEEIDVGPSAQTVNAVVHIDDEGSGVDKATISFHSPSGEVIDTGLFELSGGTPNSGAYAAKIPFERFSEAGGWKASVTVTDKVGNSRTYDPGALFEMGLPYLLQVTDNELPEEEGDKSPPELGGLAIEPQTIDTTASGRKVTVLTYVKDFGSGFAGGLIKIGSPDEHGQLESSEFHLIAGSEFEGTYETTFFFPQGSEPGEWTIYTVLLGDHAGNDRLLHDGDLAELGFPKSVTVEGAKAPAVEIGLSNGPSPSVHGQKVTFTAKVGPVVPGRPTPQGTVDFVEGGNTLGVANLTSKGTATFSTTALGAGEHKVFARYNGGSDYGEAQSESVLQQVEPASTQVSLAATLNPAPYGASSATLKATVKAVAPGAGVPAGTVTFREGETLLATVQMTGSTASLPLKALAPGTHQITAAYNGDHNDLGSEAGPYAETITVASTDLDVYSTLDPAPFGSSGLVKATVDPVAPAGGTPTGSVTFREGETVLAVVPLTGTTAKLALKGLEPGEHQITAEYGGDGNYGASSGAVAQTIVKATTRVNLTSSRNPAPVGAAGTLRAAVATVAPGGGQATGTVTFREGETVLAEAALTSGAATYPLKALPVGTHEITATYGGAANYEGSTGAISEVITP